MWQCLFKGHDWDGCTCRCCGKITDTRHIPEDYTDWSCDLCNKYHDMECEDCEGAYISVIDCAKCGHLVDEFGRLM
ncbi:MAG: hypothetical protein EOM28_07105 [Clostridia bacterium]|nr:hypothetical protein [Clostridia bacterium]